LQVSRKDWIFGLKRNDLSQKEKVGMSHNGKSVEKVNFATGDSRSSENAP